MSDECAVDDVALVVAIDEALTILFEATGRPADIIVVVPPGSLADGHDEALLTGSNGTALLVEGHAAGMAGRGTEIADAMAEGP